MAKLSETKLQILHQHYVDTFSSVQAAIKSRDRYLVYILILLVLMSFQLFAPQQAGSVLSQAVSMKLGIDSAISITFIGSIIWFALLAVVMRYFQTVINLDKLYDYIHEIEGHLNAEYSGKLFTREGVSYLANYPKFSDWSHFIYRVVLPVFLLAAVSLRIASEWMSKTPAVLPRLADTVICGLIVISVLLYLLRIHFKR